MDQVHEKTKFSDLKLASPKKLIMRTQHHTSLLLKIHQAWSLKAKKKLINTYRILKTEKIGSDYGLIQQHIKFA